MSDNNKQYIGHDIEALDDAGNYYSRHVNAMTAENLFSKSDIAAELGYRDKRIDELLAALEEEKQEVNQLKSDYQKLAQEHRFLANESARKGVRNAELEQRLQQPIKLPDELFIKISGQAVSVMSTRTVKEKIRAAGFKVEGE